MKIRIVLGALLILALAGVFWLDRVWGGGVVLTGLVVLGAALGYREIFALLPAVGTAGRVTAIVGGLALIAGPALLPAGHGVISLSLLPLVPALLMVAALSRTTPQDGIDEMRTTVFAFAYLGVLPACLIWLRIGYLEGWAIVLSVLICTKCADIGAYFTGSFIGRHKLIPRLSPNKTVEGLAGGLVLAGGMGGLLFGPVFEVPDIGLALGLVIGLVAGGFGTLGDLVESQLKRAAGVKDSGRVLPGFGGILDMIDSPILAAPAAGLVIFLLRG
jgi:phosphatidate cytidylyltransferase